MTKADFNEIEKENEYISNLLKAHQKKIAQKLDSFFDTLFEKIKGHGFIYCVHPHTSPITTSIYDGTEKDSHKLLIKDFKITEPSKEFPPVVLEIIEEWLHKETV